MALKLPIYMDHHATTPLDPRVREAMRPAWEEAFGNAASMNHVFGHEARRLAEEGRGKIARLIGAGLEEIVITSGATESNNLAIKGVFEQYWDRGNHMISCVTEHRSVLEPLRRLEKRHGLHVTYLEVGKDGRIRLEDLEKASTPETILISIMAANNEIGVLQPLKEIGLWAKARGILFHTDATQAAGKIPIDVEAMGIDLLSMSAHKMYGPKGVGALYVRSKNPYVRLVPLVDGGGHENGLRSGTLNVPGVAGFGKACEIALGEMGAEAKRLTALRDRLWEGISGGLEDVILNGSWEHRLPHNLHVSFKYVEAESLLKSISDIAVSSGSACASAKPEPSYVLRAIGVPESEIHSSIRFGLGRFNTQAEVDYTIQKVVSSVRRLRESSALFHLAKGGNVA